MKLHGGGQLVGAVGQGGRCGLLGAWDGGLLWIRGRQRGRSNGGQFGVCRRDRRDHDDSTDPKTEQHKLGNRRAGCELDTSFGREHHPVSRLFLSLRNPKGDDRASAHRGDLDESSDCHQEPGDCRRRQGS